MRKNNFIEKNKIIKLKNSSGEFEVPVHIIIEEQKRDFKATVSLRLDGEEYVGRGEGYYLDDAFADLQRKLPEGVSLRCCIACQYGNLCPYGSEADTVLCTFPEKIEDKLELVDLISGDKFALKETTFFCENFAPASDEAYTYSDFYYYLKKEN